LNFISAKNATTRFLLRQTDKATTYVYGKKNTLTCDDTITTF